MISLYAVFLKNNLSTDNCLGRPSCLQDNPIHTNHRENTDLIVVEECLPRRCITTVAARTTNKTPFICWIRLFGREVFIGPLPSNALAIQVTLLKSCSLLQLRTFLVSPFSPLHYWFRVQNSYLTFLKSRVTNEKPFCWTSNNIKFRGKALL
jgi:hypothetical protein